MWLATLEKVFHLEKKYCFHISWTLSVNVTNVRKGTMIPLEMDQLDSVCIQTKCILLQYDYLFMNILF